jgi:hypothetical protein
MTTINGLANSILHTVGNYFKAHGFQISPTTNRKFEVTTSSVADCQGLLAPAAQKHHRVVCIQYEENVEDLHREGIFCFLTINPPDPDTDEEELDTDKEELDTDEEEFDDDKQIEIQIYSEDGRIWVELSELSHQEA